MKLPLYFYETKVVGAFSIRDGDNVRIAANVDESTAQRIVTAVNETAEINKALMSQACEVMDELRQARDRLKISNAVMIDALQLVREHAPIDDLNIGDEKYLDTVVDYALSVGRTI